MKKNIAMIIITVVAVISIFMNFVAFSKFETYYGIGHIAGQVEMAAGLLEEEYDIRDSEHVNELIELMDGDSETQKEWASNKYEEFVELQKG